MGVDYLHANTEYLPPSFPRPEIFRRVFLGLYYEPFRTRLIELRWTLLRRGYSFWSLAGYRSWAAQHQLRLAYLQRRGGKAAPAGYSAHQYGLADDACLDTDVDREGLQPDYSAAPYAIMAEEAKRIGLAPGLAFGDGPHVGWPGYESAAQLEPLRLHWRSAGNATDEQKLAACWQLVDASQGRL